MSDRIQPRTLKGFRDFLPDTAIPRERLIESARSTFHRYGFSPIETPALEYTEILLGKGGDETDKQLYRFADAGGRDVAMRFDLTVPFARFAAQHVSTLGTPFKRYHVGTVWRGENPQRGRYREFVQCDFDTIGTESMAADIETALVIHDLFTELGFARFSIRVNNRKVLNGLLDQLGLHDDAGAILRSLDKLPKIGRAAVAEELASTTAATPDQVGAVLDIAALSGTNREVLDALLPLVADSDLGVQGVDELEALVAGVTAGGGEVVVDVSIARGLDYYTGTVYETFLDDLPEIGSCCSGGRYDDLASLYTKQALPGVGASLGLDRLLAAMQELDMFDGTATPADVLVAFFEADRLDTYIAMAAALRRDGIAVELYPDARKLSAQLRYADRRGHRLAVIVGTHEFEARTAQVKDLATGESIEVAVHDLSATCLQILAR